MNTNLVLIGLFVSALVLIIYSEVKKGILRSNWENKSKTLTDHIHKIGGFDPHNSLFKKYVVEEYFAYELYLQEGGKDCDVKYYQALLFLTDFEPENFVER